MTFTEAYKKLLKQYPNKVARQYVFYKGYYIFLLVPKNDTEAMVFDSYFGVNKETGQIVGYQPAADKDASDFFKLWAKGKEVSDE